MSNIIFAEKRREDSGEDGYYTMRYLVFNGELIGAYGVFYGPVEYDNNGFGMTNPRPKDPNGDGFAYGAGRDFHKRASKHDIEQIEAYNQWLENDCEGDCPSIGWGTCINDNCEYHDGAPCIFDGSSLVEVTTDDRRAFEIAAIMAGRTSDDH